MLSHLYYKYLSHRLALPDAIALAIELQAAGLTAHGDMLLAYACRLEGNHVLHKTNPWTAGSCYIAPLPPPGRMKDGDVWFDTVELAPHVRSRDIWLPLFPVYRWQYTGFIQASHYAFSSRNFHRRHTQEFACDDQTEREEDTSFVLGLSVLEIAVYCHWFQKSPFFSAEINATSYIRQLSSTQIILAGIPPQWELQEFYLHTDLSAEVIDPKWQSIPFHTTAMTVESLPNQYLPIQGAAFATTPNIDLMRNDNQRGCFPLGLTIPGLPPRPLPLVPTPLCENQRRLANAFQEYLCSNYSENAVVQLIQVLKTCELSTYACCVQLFFANTSPSHKAFEKVSRLFSAGTTFIGFYPPEVEAQENDIWFDLTELSPFLLHKGAWYPLKPVYWWQFACYISCTSNIPNSLPSETTGHLANASPSIQILPDLAWDTPVDQITLPEAIAYAKWFGKKVFDPLTGPDKDSPFSSLLRPGWRLWSTVSFNKEPISTAMAFDQINRKLTYDQVIRISSDSTHLASKWLFNPLQRHEKITFATTINQNELDKPTANSPFEFAPRPLPPDSSYGQNASLQLGLAYTEYLRDRSDIIKTEHLCTLLATSGFELYDELICQYIQARSPQHPIKSDFNPWSAADCYLGSYPPNSAERDTVWFDIVELTPSIFSGQRWIPLKPVYTWQFIAFLHCSQYTINSDWDYMYRIDSLDDKTELLKSLNHITEPLSPVVNIQLAEACAYARWFNKQLFDPFLISDPTTAKYLPNPDLKFLTDLFPSPSEYDTLIFDNSNQQLLSEEDVMSEDLHESQLSIYHCYERHDAVFATCPDTVSGQLIPLDFELEKMKTIALRNQVIR